MSILILLRGVDKGRFFHRRGPEMVTGIHHLHALPQLHKDRLAKAQEAKLSPPQQQSMFSPDHNARSRHEYPVPALNRPDQETWPKPSQDRQPLALKTNVLNFILEDLIAKPADRH